VKKNAVYGLVAQNLGSGVPDVQVQVLSPAFMKTFKADALKVFIIIL